MRLKRWLNLLLVINLFANAWLPVYAATGVTEMTSAARPPASPARQGTCPGFWRYPVAVTAPGSSSIGGSTFTSLSPELVLGPEDDQGGGARVSWGTLPGGQTWVQGVFDLGAIITLDTNCTLGGSNVEAQTHSLSISGSFNWGTPRLQVSASPNGPWSTLLSWPAYPQTSYQELTRTASVNVGPFRYVRLLDGGGYKLTGGTMEILWDYVRFVPNTIEFVPILPPDQTLARNECPFCGNEDRQNYVGGPINTFSGNYGYQTTDFNIPTAGQPLRFERSYNSYTVANSPVYTRPLGYGWTHNYDLDLTFAPGEVQLKAPHGSRMRFIDNGDDTYSPYFGVWAEMVSSGSGATAVYTVTAANQETFVFNHLGRWIRHLDPKGNETTLTRTNGVTLTRVTGPTGQRWLDFSYDTQGRLSTVTDHAGRQVSYSYDANDNLITVTDTRGNTWGYSYNANHLLQEVIDPENKLIERTLYDGQGRAIRQEDGVGNVVIEITYLSSGQRLITDHGRQSSDIYDPATNLLIKQTDALNRNRNYTLDNNFNRTRATDPRGNATGYAKTAFGLTTAITDALNNPTAYSYDVQNNLTAATDAQGTTISYSYDSQNNLTQINTPTGPINYGYNAAGQVTSVTNRRGHTWNYQYDAAGNLTQITNPKSQITTLQYDTLGRLTTLTNARNMTTRFEYDPADNLTRVTLNEQPGPCDPTECNLVTEYRYDKANRLTAIIDPQGRETRREYDAAGRLSRVIANYQNGAFSNAAPDEDIITRYAYDQYGRLQSVFQTLNQSEERETRYEYDALNRIASITVNYAPGSSDPDQNLTTTYAYEDSGSKLIVTVTGPDGIAIRTEYDELGRPAKIIRNYQPGPCPANECNLTTTYNYDAVSNLTSLVDPLGIRTQHEYDALNRLTAVIENYTGSGVYSGIPDENIKTSFQYDPEGNLLQLAINNEQLANYQYDELNRVIQQANALNHTWQYQYDPAGNLTQITDPKLQITHYQYDLLNRLTQIHNSPFKISTTKPATALK